MKWLESTPETFLDEKIHPWVWCILKSKGTQFQHFAAPLPSLLALSLDDLELFIPVLYGHWSDHVLGW